MRPGAIVQGPVRDAGLLPSVGVEYQYALPPRPQGALHPIVGMSKFSSGLDRDSKTGPIGTKL